VGAGSGGGGSGGSVATRCLASGLLGVGAGRAHSPNKAPGPYARASPSMLSGEAQYFRQQWRTRSQLWRSSATPRARAVAGKSN